MPHNQGLLSQLGAPEAPLSGTPDPEVEEADVGQSDEELSLLMAEFDDVQLPTADRIEALRLALGL